METRYDEYTIGAVLTRLRQAHGFSQETLAEKLGAISGHPTVSRAEVSRWERQERIPSEFWLWWLAEALGVSIDRLREAVAAARYHRTSDRVDRSDVIPAWLTLHHGPNEIMIALTGVWVDKLRTVLTPVTSAPEPADSPSTVPLESHR